MLLFLCLRRSCQTALTTNTFALTNTTMTEVHVVRSKDPKSLSFGFPWSLFGTRPALAKTNADSCFDPLRSFNAIVGVCEKVNLYDVYMLVCLCVCVSSQMWNDSISDDCVGSKQLIVLRVKLYVGHIVNCPSKCLICTAAKRHRMCDRKWHLRHIVLNNSSVDNNYPTMQ